MSKSETIKEPKTKNKGKHIANISLGVMGAGALATVPFANSVTMGILQGGFEAGLVGGLADWFAVTALFRHPLNIPIPHTALLPKNREKITQTILNIVETEWLNKESILQKLENIHFTNIGLTKLEEALKHEKTKMYIAEILANIIQMIDKKQIETMTLPLMEDVAKGIETKETLSKLIDTSLSRNYDEKVFAILFDLMEKKISDPYTKEKITAFILKTMEKKAESSFFKLALKPLVSVGKDKLSTTIEKAIDDILLDLKDENSENRKSIILYIQKELSDLKENEEILHALENKKDVFIESETFKNANTHIVGILVDKLSSLSKDESFITEKMIPLLQRIVTKVKDDESLITRIECGIKQALVLFIEQNHSKIGNLVRDNLEKMKNEELIDMVENKIGKDLAWIRVNGAICGFIIGIGIASLKALF